MADDANHPRSRSAAASTRLVVLVSNRQDLPIDEAGLVRLAEECLIGEGVGDAELSISFVADEEMAELRDRYLGEEGPTDVLSFGFDDPDSPVSIPDVPDVPVPDQMLGDVVIAPAYAAANAHANGGRAADELRLLVAHGILHLLGYDHEAEDERAIMWARQERYSGVRA